MKRYIRSSVEFDPLDTERYRYYCNYTVTNPTWGADAERLLESIGGIKYYTRLGSTSSNTLTSARWLYLFESPAQYNEFKQLLEEHDLSDFVKLRKLNRIADFQKDVSRYVILEED